MFREVFDLLVLIDLYTDFDWLSSHNISVTKICLMYSIMLLFTKCFFVIWYFKACFLAVNRQHCLKKLFFMLHIKVTIDRLFNFSIIKKDINNSEQKCVNLRRSYCEKSGNKFVNITTACVNWKVYIGDGSACDNSPQGSTCSVLLFSLANLCCPCNSLLVHNGIIKTDS